MGKIASADYREKVKDAELFLNGRFKSLEDEWESQMYELSAKMEFEQAKEIRDRLFAIRSMGERVMISEITKEDIQKSVERSDSINELKQVLAMKRMPAVIEGFDNSNIQGTDAVSSMVRFLNGLPDKNNYRRFKVKTVTGADDFTTMRDVVLRRYCRLIRKNEKMPDLILIDGGKGQLNAAMSALEELRLQLPIVSLAKKNEEIYMPHKDKPLVLSRHSPALRLLQSVRDEAHRFAIQYHRKLREKIV
jgi:excinuclease ABC subunit C